MKGYEGYIEALEGERRKIQVFARELPLCLELVTHAIKTCKQQMAARSECSEHTTRNEGPVLEEFIPIKRSPPPAAAADDDEQTSDGSKEGPKNEKPLKKSDWLSSVQLWNQTPDPPTKLDPPKVVPVVEVKRNGGGAFHPFKREKASSSTVTAMSPPPIPVAAAAASSTGESGGYSGGGGICSSKKEEKEGQNQRKARRCWSPELHRHFLKALHHLGGSQVATPKQIRELMKVDGLTNDEVKSHLQKYRLHTRRPTASIQNNNDPQPPPHFLVVGGIWVPPTEYPVAGTAAVSGEGSRVSTPTTVYAPVAAPPLDEQQRHKKPKHFHADESGSLSSGGGRSSSPATSSSTHTSQASPARRDMLS